MRNRLVNLPTIILLIAASLTIVGIIIVWTTEPDSYASSRNEKSSSHSGVLLSFSGPGQSLFIIYNPNTDTLQVTKLRGLDESVSWTDKQLTVKTKENSSEYSFSEFPYLHPPRNDDSNPNPQLLSLLTESNALTLSGAGSIDKLCARYRKLNCVEFKRFALKPKVFGDSSRSFQVSR